MTAHLVVKAAPTPGGPRLHPLFSAARDEGLRFLERLAAEYESGTNRFDGPGERLLSAAVDERVIAIGGLNRDPYLGDPSIGRLRHLYVLPDWRGRGVGRALVERLLQEGHAHFEQITLRVPAHSRFGGSAGHFYESLGFRTTVRWPTVTHSLRFGPS